MKILKLSIENINSLKGKHIIDFTNFVGRGELFAITGQTGSGKSSILTAISLALYGKSYRPTLSAFDYITNGEKKSSIELEYEVKSIVYKAIWKAKIRKSKSDKKSVATERIFLKEEQIINDKPDKIIGQSYDQFKKSVILNQGQFSDFLSSSFSERKKILEKLYSESTLTNLSKKIKENLQSTKQEINSLSIKIDSTLPYEESEIKSKNKTIKALKKDLSKKEVIKSDIEKGKSIFKEFDSLLEKACSITTKELELKKKINDKDSALLELEKKYWKQEEDFSTTETIFNERIFELKKAIKDEEKYQNLLKLIETSKDKYQKLSLKLKDCDKLLDSKKVNLDSLTESIKNFPFKEIAETDLLIITDELKKIYELSIEKSKLINVHDLTKAQLESNQKEIENLQSSLKNIQKKQVDIGYNIPELNNAIESSSKNIEKIKHDILNLRPLIENISKIEGEELSLSKRLIHLKDERSKIDKELFKTQKRQLQDELSKAIYLCKMEANKKSKCPVCDQNLKDKKTSLKKTEQRDNEGLEKIVESLSKEISELDKSISVDEKIIKNLHENKSKTLVSIQKIESEYKDDTPKEKLKKEENVHKILYKKKEQLITISSEKKSFQTQINNLKQKSPPLIESVKSFEAKLNIIKDKTLIHIAKIKEDYPEIEKLLKGQSISKIIEEVNLFNTQKEKISFLKKEIVNTNKNINEIKNDIKLLSEDISKSKNEKKVIFKKLNTLSPNMSIIETISNEEKAFKVIETKLKKDKEVILALKSENELLKNTKNNYQGQLQDIETLLLKYFVELKELLKIPKMTESFPDLGPSDQTLTSLLDKKTLYHHYQENHFYPFIESFYEEYEKDKKLIVELQSAINLYNEKKAALEKIEKDQRLLKDKLLRIEKLYYFAGNDEFKNYVLGILEKELIRLSNIELSMLCDGRYYLTLSDARIGHEFAIIDNWQEGSIRKVSTLSGGETFLISLGLALALSKMNKGELETDCFFIDEGFGTLDSESIQEVTKVLLALESSGRQVGIISHIRELTDQIPININLKKDSFGHSKVMANF